MSTISTRTNIPVCAGGSGNGRVSQAPGPGAGRIPEPLGPVPVAEAPRLAVRLHGAVSGARSRPCSATTTRGNRGQKEALSVQSSGCAAAPHDPATPRPAPAPRAAARTTHHAPRTTHQAPRTTHHAPHTAARFCVAAGQIPNPSLPENPPIRSLCPSEADRAGARALRGAERGRGGGGASSFLSSKAFSQLPTALSGC